MSGLEMSRRGVLHGVSVLAAVKAVEKTTDGGLAELVPPASPRRERPVLPPGAGKAEDFRLKCVGCGLCLAKCPGQCIVQSSSLGDFGQVRLDFRQGFCRLACNFRCASVCPAGALRPLAGVPRKYVHLGTATWSRERCLRTEGEKCTACVRKCPVKAIHLVEGVPHVDRDACIGCGACEHVCPARPEPAIVVQGLSVQRVVRPVGEADLLDEMRLLVAGGKACVVAKAGVIVRQLEGRGIDPILAELERDGQSFEGALVYDKIVGRAAAAVYVVGRARKIAAEVMSRSAVALLEHHGIATAPVKVVDEIRNRAGSGMCPMDSAILKIEDPEAMLGKLKEMRK